MKKHWLSLILGVMTIATLLMACNWKAQLQAQIQTGEFPPVQATDFSTTASVHSRTPTLGSIGSIDAERLLADVKALSYQRYAERDRDRAREYIRQSLEQAHWQPRLLPFTQTTADGVKQGVNIVAKRQGTEANAEVILLAGHYDTVEQSPGADDNATAVATVLEAARVLGQHPTPRTLQLALFDLEEIGLVGSTAFVEQQNQTANLHGAIVMDMLGYTCDTAGCQTYPEALPIDPPSDRGNFLAVIGDMGHPFLIDSFKTANRRELPPIFTLAIPTLGRFTPDLVRSDHAPFWRNGLGAVLVTDTANFRNPNYHQESDRPETLNPEFLTGAAQLVIEATANLLQGDSNL